MATAIDYAQLAGRVYQRTARNRTPLAADWTEVTWIPNGRISGFSAGVYQKGNEVVLSFTGTNERLALDTVAGSLPIGASLPSAQVIEAMVLYMETRQQFPGAQISFTGHSLGGGLASMMAVFFDKPATVFDAAPFELGARNLVTLGIYQIEMTRRGFSDSAFDAYTRSIDFAEFNRREAQVAGYSIQGEILEALRSPNTVIMGSETTYSVGPQTVLGTGSPAELAAARVNLHSMTLLSSMMLSSSFALAVRNLPSSVEVLFNGGLYARDPQVSATPNLLDHLLRQHMGDTAAGIAGNEMLDRFGQDLVRIAATGSTANAGISRGLIAAVAEHYYFSSGSALTAALTDIPGGVQMDVENIPQNPDPADGRGVQQLRNALFTQLQSDALASGYSALNAATRFTIQTGGSGLNVALEGARNDAVLGFSAADVLSGGEGHDVLIGQAGADRLTGGDGMDVLSGGSDDDTLAGGANSDWLAGGAGDDRYEFEDGHGGDTIVDSDGQDTLWFGGQQITGGKKVDDNYWISDDRQFGFARVPNGSGGYDLVITRGSRLDQIRIRDWAAGRMGLTLDDAAAYQPQQRESFGGDFVKEVRYDDPTRYAFDAYGNYVADPDGQPGTQPDLITGTGGGDDINGGTGNDGVGGYGGDDVLTGGSGDDVLSGGAGRDELNGGDGNDYLFGSGAGSVSKPTATTQAPPVAGGPELSRGHGWVAYDGGIDTNGKKVYVVSGIDVGSVAGDAGNVLDGGAGDDRIAAGVGDDVAYGGADDDSVSGLAGNDALFGDDGNDTIEGDGTALQGYVESTPEALHGADTLDGGAGDDTLIGQGGADVLYGGNGADKLWGDEDEVRDTPLAVHGDDLLDGGGGNDQLVGSGGRDLLFGGADNDTLIGDDDAERVAGTSHGDDVLDGGDGDDALRGDGGDDMLIGGDGADTLIGDAAADHVPAQFHGRDHLEGGDGNDTLEGGAKDDELFGGTGNDRLSGDASESAVAGADHGDDYLGGEDGDDTLVGGGGADHLVGGAGADSLSGDDSDVSAQHHGDDHLDGEGGVDQMIGGGGNDVLRGGDDNDVMQGDATDGSLEASFHGADHLDGGAGDDQVSGDGGADVVIGGAGDDTLSGDNGAAVLDGSAHGNDVVDGGDGNDTVFGDGGNDTVLGGDGADTLSGDDSGLAVTFHGNDSLDGGSGDDTLIGGGGNDLLLGGDGNDVLMGDDGAIALAQCGADTLDGGAGNDQLQGNGGADAYVFGRGYGNDVLLDRDAVSGAVDRVRLVGLSQDDVTLEREGGTFNLVIRIVDTGETLTVANQFYAGGASATEFAIEALDFADGTSMSVEQISQNSVRPQYGTAAADHLSGTNESDLLRGGGGNDTLSGQGGNDRLFGDDGDDSLDGSLGDDELDGGAGNDLLTGGWGSDTFVYRRGNGQDRVSEFSSLDDVDVIRLEGMTAADVSLLIEGNDLVIAIDGTTDRLRVLSYFAEGAKMVESIRFADGLTLDKTAVTQRAISILTGSVGNDYLSGTSFADRIDGGAGDDSLGGGYGDDILIGGVGNDALGGHAGNDTYVFGRGDGRDVITDTYGDASGAGNGDRVVFGAGIVAADVVFTARSDLPAGDPDYLEHGATSSSDLIVALAGSADRLVITGFFTTDNRIESFVFADGTAISAAQLMAGMVRTEGTVGDDALRGSAGADTMAGDDGNDVAHGFEGDDTIDGGAGNDRLYGDEGNDILRGGTGYNTLYGGAGNDRLEGGAEQSGSLYGEDGNDVLIAGSGGTLEGGAGDDVLDSGAGVAAGSSASYRGGAGSDTYVLRAGMGHVSISDVDDAPTSVDVVKFADLNLADMRITQDTYSVTLASLSNPNDSLKIHAFNDIGPANTVADQIRFADGTELTVDQLITLTLTGGTGPDRLRGTYLADTFDGGGGNDTLYGQGGDDVIRGGSGNDILYGMQGSDLIEGGAGHDTLDGAAGGVFISPDEGTNTLVGGAGNDCNVGAQFDDIFVFGRGDGSDTIEDAGTGMADTLRLGVGVLPQHLSLYRDGNDLVVVIDGSTTQTRIKSYYTQSNRPIERIEFDGGAGPAWAASQIDSAAITGAVDALAGTAGNDVFDVDNTLDTITEAADSGVDEVRTSVGYTLPANVENIIATGALNLTLRGNALDNLLRGNAADNAFRVSGGVDTAYGGLGNDMYYIERDPSGAIGEVAGVEYAGEGYDSIIQGTADWAYYWYSVSLPENVERLVLGETTRYWYNTYTGNVTPRGGYGNGGDNEIVGDVSLENFLDGGGGRDVLVGSLQGDVYVVDSDDDTIMDPLQSEYNRNEKRDVFTGAASMFSTGDLVLSSAPDFVLPDRVENIQLQGTADLDATGNEGANALVGNTGNNVLAGEAGNDVLHDQPPQSGYYASYTTDADTLLGGDGNDSLTSYAGSDTLRGGAGNDTLSARNSAATMAGGTGDDILVASGIGSAIHYGLGDGNDTVSCDLRHAEGRDRLVFGAGIAVADVTMARTGTDGADLLLTIVGSGSVLLTAYFSTSGLDGYRHAALASIEFADGTIWRRTTVDQFFGLPVDPEGTAGDDVLVGTPARNTIHAHGGNDQVSGGPGGDALYAGTGNDTLNGDEGDDTLYGEEGDDVLDGGDGGDALYGGTGNDIYRDADGMYSIYENVDEGIDTLEVTTSGWLSDNVEIGIITGTADGELSGSEQDNVLHGNAGADTLYGNGGNDRLDGGSGADEMVGGLGDDTYVSDTATDAITEHANEGIDTIISNVTRTLGSHLENLTLAGASAINATGNALANVLTGNAANNALNGGAGADTLIGGAGNDAYTVDNAGDVVTELAGEGTDTVSSSVTYTLAAQVENLTLTGSSAIHATGNALDNVLSGNSGNNTLTGGAGNDTLNGGTGNDTMRGGTGNDTYVVNVSTDVVTEFADEGIDTVQSSVTLTLGNNVENLTLTGSSAINGTGNALDNVLTGNSANNTLTGNAGNDTLDGGAGTDTMRGGAGNDIYVVERSADVVTESANQGTDTVRSSVTWTLGSNLENLTLTGTAAVNGAGNALNNTLTGNAAANTLAGAAGNDSYAGGAGNDTLSDTSTTSSDVYAWGRGEGADTLTDAGGTDRLDILAGATEDQIWLRRMGNHLELSVIGTGDRFTVNNWYSNTANRVESFRLADGQALQASKVQQLVDAMAAFAPPAAGQTTLPPPYQQQLGATISANWV